MRLSPTRRSERGDTIIEVIFAVVIFALVAVGSLTIMNQGIATAERALEVTLVRQQMDAQAEALRYIHDVRLAAAAGSSSTWSDLITTYGQPGASPYGTGGGRCEMPNGGGYKPFILNARTAQVSPNPPVVSVADSAVPPYPQVIYKPDSSIDQAYGLWIEAVPSSSLPLTRFVDFHIRACWDGPGSSVPMTLGTIVRLYDPR
jgi:type II secretory pathway pseudopilin PulG